MDFRTVLLFFTFIFCYKSTSADDHLIVRRQMPTMAPFPLNPFNQAIQQSAGSIINRLQSNLNPNLFGLRSPTSANLITSSPSSTSTVTTPATTRPTRTTSTRNTSSLLTVSRGRRELQDVTLSFNNDTTFSPQTQTASPQETTENMDIGQTNEPEVNKEATTVENSGVSDDEQTTELNDEVSTESPDSLEIVSDVTANDTVINGTVRPHFSGRLEGFASSFRASDFGVLTPNSLPLVLGSKIRASGAESRAVQSASRLNITIPVNTTSFNSSINVNGTVSIADPSSTIVVPEIREEPTQDLLVVQTIPVVSRPSTVGLRSSQGTSTQSPFVFTTSNQSVSRTNATTDESANIEENDMNSPVNTTGSPRILYTGEPITGVYPINTTRLTIFNLRAQNVTNVEEITATETSPDAAFMSTEDTDVSLSTGEPFSGSISEAPLESMDVTSDEFILGNGEENGTTITTTAFSRETITGLYPTNTTRMTVFNLTLESGDESNITVENSTSYENLFGMNEEQQTNYSVPFRRGHYVNGEWEWYDTEEDSNTTESQGDGSSSTMSPLFGNATLLSVSQLTQEDSETKNPILQTQNLTQSQIQQDLMDDDTLTRPPSVFNNYTTLVNISTTSSPDIDEEFDETATQYTLNNATSLGSTIRSTTTSASFPDFVLAEDFDSFLSSSVSLPTRSSTISAAKLTPVVSTVRPSTVSSSQRTIPTIQTTSPRSAVSQPATSTTSRNILNGSSRSSPSTTTRAKSITTSSTRSSSTLAKQEDALAPWSWGFDQAERTPSTTTGIVTRSRFSTYRESTSTRSATTTPATSTARTSTAKVQNKSTARSASLTSVTRPPFNNATTHMHGNTSASSLDQQISRNANDFAAQQSDDFELSQRSLLMPVVANGDEQRAGEKPLLELLAPPTVRPVPRRGPETSLYVPADPADEKKFWSLVPKPMNSAQVGKLRSATSRINPYPTFTQPQRTSFSCTNVKPGWYADPETGCQGFVRCDLRGGQHRFICPPTTLFSQITQTCDYFYNIDCEAQVKYADYINSRLYSEIDLSRYHYGRSESRMLAERSRPLITSSNDVAGSAGSHRSSTSLQPSKTDASTTKLSATTTTVSSTTVRPTSSHAFIATSSLPKIITASTRIPEPIMTPVNVTGASNLPTVKSNVTSLTSPSTLVTTTPDTAGIEEP